MTPQAINFMGVAGSGKITIGTRSDRKDDWGAQ